MMCIALNVHLEVSIGETLLTRSCEVTRSTESPGAVLETMGLNGFHVLYEIRLFPFNYPVLNAKSEVKERNNEIPALVGARVEFSKRTTGMNCEHWKLNGATTNYVSSDFVQRLPTI